MRPRVWEYVYRVLVQDVYERRRCRRKTVVVNSAATAAAVAAEFVDTTVARERDTKASGVKTEDKGAETKGIINCYTTFYLGPWRHRRLRVTSLDFDPPPRSLDRRSVCTKYRLAHPFISALFPAFHGCISIHTMPGGGGRGLRRRVCVSGRPGWRPRLFIPVAFVSVFFSRHCDAYIDKSGISELTTKRPN